MTPEQLAEVDRLIAIPSFENFRKRVAPKFKNYRHCDELGKVLQRVANGELKRVMIFEPPRHGKSELTSKLFTAYYLRRNPEHFVAIASHTAELAHVLSRDAQQYFLADGGKTKYGSEGVKHWETLKGGGLWACGIGGPATGKGFNLGVIDDPIKSAEEAQSYTYREKHKDWYRSVWYTRMEPNAALVVIQTRWNEDDLAGWLLSLSEDEREKWYIVNLPAICEESIVVPHGCTLHKDWREIGQALCRERYPVHRLEKIKQTLGAYWWAALYQQSPKAKDGDIYKRAELYGENGKNLVEDFPRDIAAICRYWDRAASERVTADETASAVQIRDDRGLFTVGGFVGGRWQAFERDAVIVATAKRDREIFGEQNCPHIKIEKQIGQGGSEADEVLGRKLAGFSFEFDSATTSKGTRNQPFASQVKSNNVRWVKENGLWKNEKTLEYIFDQLCSFTVDEKGNSIGAHDDFVDALSGSHNHVAEDSYKLYT